MKDWQGKNGGRSIERPFLLWNLSGEVGGDRPASKEVDLRSTRVSRLKELDHQKRLCSYRGRKQRTGEGIGWEGSGRARKRGVLVKTKQE